MLCIANEGAGDLRESGCVGSGRWCGEEEECVGVVIR